MMQKYFLKYPPNLVIGRYSTFKCETFILEHISCKECYHIVQKSGHFMMFGIVKNALKLCNWDTNTSGSILRYFLIHQRNPLHKSV